MTREIHGKMIFCGTCASRGLETLIEEGRQLELGVES